MSTEKEKQDAKDFKPVWGEERYNPLKCPRCGKKDVRWNGTKQTYMCRVCGKRFKFDWAEDNYTNRTVGCLAVALPPLDEIIHYAKKGNCSECIIERVEEVKSIINQYIKLKGKKEPVDST